MRRWIGYACAVVALGGAAWYFGKPRTAPVPVPPAVVSVQSAPAETPKAPPPKVIEVIDLARTYEPVPEPEPVHVGGVDPASFIEEQSAPARIPPAVDFENPFADVLRVIQEAPTGSFILGAGLNDESMVISGQMVETLRLMPREVSPPECLEVMPREVKEWYSYTPIDPTYERVDGPIGP